jgi:hypothetical protein
MRYDPAPASAMLKVLASSFILGSFSIDAGSTAALARPHAAAREELPLTAVRSRSYGGSFPLIVPLFHLL